MKQLTPSIKNWRTLQQMHGKPIMIEEGGLSKMLVDARRHTNPNALLEVQEQPAFYALTLG
jgi:hypothetical protein